MKSRPAHAAPEELTQLLLQVGIPAHMVGFDQLCVLIPRYETDKRQCLSKELYPYTADALGYDSWKAVEHSIRDAIGHAWKHRDPEVWAAFFPGSRKAPSNKHFIATMAEHIQR